MPWFTILIFFFSFNSDSVKASAYDLFIEASSLENQGKYEEAIKVYQKAIEYDPSSTELYRNIARLYTRLKKYKEALHYAHKALKIAPEDVENIKLTGTIYLQKLDINKGIKYFEMAQTLMPDDEEIMINLSYLYEGMNLFHKAEELLERITKTNPSLESYFRLGQISARMNNHSKALKYYYKALEFDSNSVPVLVGIGASYDFIDKPDSALIFYQIASTLDTANLNLKKRLVDLYTKLDRFDDLIDLCYEILRKNPFEFEVRRNLGYALYKNNRKLQALEQFLIGVGMNPKDSYGLFQAARIYVDLGQLTMALATIKDALKINPDNPDLLTYLGFIYLDLKKNAEADATFKRAIIKGGDRAQLYYLLGITATLRRDLKTAYQYYQKAIEVNSKNPKVWSAYGHLCDDLNFKREALAAFEKVVELDTTNATALNYVGYTYAEQGVKLDYALKLITRALAIEDSNGYFIDSLGWVYFMMGNYETALEQLKKAVSLVEDAVILEHLGDTYLKLNDSIRAKEAYEKALKLKPKEKNLRKKLARLKSVE